MIALLIIIYCVGIWLVYVKLKITPNPVNLAVASVIGIVSIGGVVILWRFAAPSSDNAVVARYAIEIVPQVKGPITKLHAKPNVPLEKGTDILFEIQKDTYQNTVNEIAGALRAAENAVEQLREGGVAALAAIRAAEATAEAAKAELDVALNVQQRDPDAIADLQVVQLQQQYNAAAAMLDESRAKERRGGAELQAAINTVQSLEAKLANAQFNLDQCMVYAPADGFVVNWQVREGTMAVSFPFAPLGTFVDTSRSSILASFPQNLCRYIESGDPIEIALKTRPGEVFPGTVEQIVQASGEGQFATSGQLINAASIGSGGQFVVSFRLDDSELERQLSMGTAGTVVVYTKRGKPLHVISKVLVRVNAWKYYLMPF